MENFRRKSFWLETAGEFEPQPELKGDVKTDIAIIGGGFTGLSTAYHIKKIDPSIDVAIVENQICYLSLIYSNEPDFVRLRSLVYFSNQLR